jgi:predicted nucleic acid-binding protein
VSIVFLLDTNIVSEALRRSPDSRVVARLNRDAGLGLFICAVTVFELRFGAARSARPAALWGRIQREIIGRFDVLPFEAADAIAAADIMSALEGSGRNAALQDIWLAGTAANRNLTFVTRNRRHFDPILNLKVENWFE